MVNKELGGWADIVAKRFTSNKCYAPPEDILRDICDLQTSGELDTFQLDLLTDMVRVRLNKAAIAKAEGK